MASMRPGRFAPDNTLHYSRSYRSLQASMRPGRFAPDNVKQVRVQDYDNASMRPGRFAPDNDVYTTTMRLHQRASMRPGRFAPDNPTGDYHAIVGKTSFNEAGAVCPG